MWAQEEVATPLNRAAELETKNGWFGLCSVEEEEEKTDRGWWNNKVVSDDFNMG